MKQAAGVGLALEADGYTFSPMFGAIPTLCTTAAFSVGLALGALALVPAAGPAQVPACPSLPAGGSSQEVFSSPPVLKNRTGFLGLIEQAYPRELRRQGVAGTSRVLVLIDTLGLVHRPSVRRGSGIPALDSAAVQVAKALHFFPAMLDRRPTCVWLEIPIIFLLPHLHVGPQPDLLTA
jgi:TonB family protein